MFAVSIPILLRFFSRFGVELEFLSYARKHKSSSDRNSAIKYSRIYLQKHTTDKNVKFKGLNRP